MNNAPCTKATHTASNTVSRSPTAWAFWDARKSQVSNSTYALKQNKPKTNAKRISNCQCSCCSLLSLYHLLPGTNTSTFVQSCCRKDQETDSVWIWSLCTCTNTFDSKGAWGGGGNPGRSREMPCTALALPCPTLPLNPASSAAGTDPLKIWKGTTTMLLEWKTPPHCSDPGFHY